MVIMGMEGFGDAMTGRNHMNSYLFMSSELLVWCPITCHCSLLLLF